ncbi:MAG: ATP synthase F0 subunit B [Proteobacteria bacterium]|nr:ATP synthase F0 subunit B [Pseudomonadota bacterium]
MKINRSPYLKFVSIILGALFFIHFLPFDAFASEAGGWRPTYDLIMRWLNFFILAYIIVRFAKKPVVNFLKEKKDKIAQEISAAEQQNLDAQKKNADMLEKIKRGNEHISSIKQKIIEEGERKKQEIIRNAKNQSILILEKTKKKIEYQVYSEKEKLKSELIESAIGIAMGKLPSAITKEDNQKFIDNYLAYKFSK